MTHGPRPLLPPPQSVGSVLLSAEFSVSTWVFGNCASLSGSLVRGLTVSQSSSTGAVETPRFSQGGLMVSRATDSASGPEALLGDFISSTHLKARPPDTVTLEGGGSSFARWAGTQDLLHPSSATVRPAGDVTKGLRVGSGQVSPGPVHSSAGQRHKHCLPATDNTVHQVSEPAVQFANRALWAFERGCLPSLEGIVIPQTVEEAWTFVRALTAKTSNVFLFRHLNVCWVLSVPMGSQLC